MNRSIMLIGTLSVLLLLTTTGCLTQKFYESYDTSSRYDETVVSYLITEDGSKFVVLGKKYHYIFVVNPHLKQVLLGSFRPVVVTRFSNFYVRVDNMIGGDYVLSLSKDATNEQRNSAVNAGFTLDEQSNLSLTGHIEGTRYSAEGFPSISASYKFNRPYVITIKEEQSRAKLAGKILLTPIVVLADGVLILGGIALMLFMGGCGGCG